MVEIDSVSQLVTADTDLSLAQLEDQLGVEGYTLNYFVPPDNGALLADALSRRLPNLYASAFGGIEDLCLQVKLAQADGLVYANVKTPRSAAGPSLKKMAIGAGSWLGLPIQATLRIFPKPAHREYRAWAFPSARELEAFEASLARGRGGFALSARLVTEAAMRLFEGISLLDQVRGFAWWGQEGEMRSVGAELETFASARQGRALSLKSEHGLENFAALLQREAEAAAASAAEARASALPASHRPLAGFLREGT